MLLFIRYCNVLVCLVKTWGFFNSVNYVLTPIHCIKEGTLGSAADSACFYKALAIAGTFLLAWALLNGGVNISVIRTGNL